MPAELDPYRDWIGITTAQRPLSYYQLVGVERSETNDAVIVAAADERIAIVTKQIKGPHARLARRTLFELEAAKNCLLDPVARASYDESLKSGSMSRSGVGIRNRDEATSTDNASPPPSRGSLSDLLDEALPIQSMPEVPANSAFLQLQPARKSRKWKPREAWTAVGVIIISAAVLVGLGAVAVSFIESLLDGSGGGAPPVVAANQSAQPPEQADRNEIQRRHPSSTQTAFASQSGTIEAQTVNPRPRQTESVPRNPTADTELTHHRLPAPPADEVAMASRYLKARLAKQLDQAETPELKLKIAQSLLDSSVSGQTSAARFAELEMARTLALAANDARLFAQIVDQTAVEFEIDGLTVKVDGLCILFDRQLAPEPRRNLVRTSVMFVNRLAAAERYDEAVKLAKLSFAAARELGDERIVAYLASRGKELVASQARSVAAKAALAVLAERPNDPTANEQAGLWFWLDKLDRDRGFAYLAKAEDEQLRTAVVAALANPAAPPAQLTLADTWFDLGKGLTTGAKRAAILRESLQWYRRALVHLPAATTAYKRVVALEREVGSRTVPPLVVDLDQATSKLPLDQDDEGATTVQLEILRIDGFAPPPRLPTGAQRLTFSIPVRLVLHETDPRIEIQFVLKSVNGQRLLAVSPVFVETAGSLLPFTNQRISALSARLPNDVADLRARIAGLDKQIQDLKVAGANLAKAVPMGPYGDSEKTIRLQQMQRDLNRLVAQEASLVKSLGPLEQRLAMLPALEALRRGIHNRISIGYQVSTQTKKGERTVLLETN